LPKVIIGEILESHKYGQEVVDKTLDENDDDETVDDNSSDGVSLVDSEDLYNDDSSDAGKFYSCVSLLLFFKS
jgi:hypothetical protein